MCVEDMGVRPASYLRYAASASALKSILAGTFERVHHSSLSGGPHAQCTASEEGNVLTPVDVRVNCATGAITQGVLVERIMAATEPARMKLVLLAANPR